MGVVFCSVILTYSFDLLLVDLNINLLLVCSSAVVSFLLIKALFSHCFLLFVASVLVWRQWEKLFTQP